MSAKISQLTEKLTLGPDDLLLIVDSDDNLNKKIVATTIDARTSFPNQTVDLTRAVAPFPLISNGATPGAAITIAERNVTLCPIFVPKTLVISHWGIRASGAGSPAFDVQYGIYSHQGGLPTTLLASQNYSIPILAANQFDEQAFATPITLERGIYWQAFLNKSPVTVSLATATPNNSLFNNLIGTSTDITGAEARCFTTVVPLADNQLPLSLTSRTVDMRTTTASQATLRLRVSVNMNYWRYF